MKKIQFILPALFTCIFLFFSCSDDDNGKEGDEQPAYELSERMKDTLYIGFDKFTEVETGLHKYTIEFGHPVEVDTNSDYYRFILEDGTLSKDLYFIYRNPTYEAYYELGEESYTLYFTSGLMESPRTGIMLVIAYYYKYYLE